MKIALVCEWIDPARGGAETSTWRFARALAQRGHEVHLFTRSRSMPEGTECGGERDGLHLRTVVPYGWLPVQRFRSFVSRADRVVLQEPFDVIHAVSPCRNADLYQPRGGTFAETRERNLDLVPAGWRRGLARAAWRLNAKRRLLLRLERAIMAPDGPQALVALSGYVIEQFHRHYAVDPRRIYKVFNAVEPVSLPTESRGATRERVLGALNLPVDAFVILFAAHNFRLKGLTILLDAVSKLWEDRAGPLALLVAGRGKLRASHLRPTIREGVRVLGNVPDMALLYHVADVLAHPTFYDPCSRVVLEATSVGVPVVTTRWDGASEGMADAAQGCVLEKAGDSALLAEALREMRKRRLPGAERPVPIRPADRARSFESHVDAMIQLYQGLRRASSRRGRRVG